MIRSILAVLAGVAALTISSFTIEAIINPLIRWAFSDASANDEPAARILMIVYTTICVAIGGYVTAWVARRSEALHALIMGVIQLMMTAAALFALPGKAPLWFWLTGMALIAPAAWFGGALRARELKGD